VTIPIIPGPFSFIAELGRAGGAASAFNIKQHGEDRQNAQEDVKNILDLVTAGRLPPEKLNDPQIVARFRAAGIPLPSPIDISTSIPIPGIGGTMSADIHRPGPFQETPQDIKNRIAAGYFKSIAGASPTSPVAAHAIGQETPAEAGAKEATTVAGATQATAQASTAQGDAEAQVAKDKVSTDIMNGALKILGSDPEARQLATAAALGYLPYLTGVLANNRQFMSVTRQHDADQLRIMLGSINNVSDIYRTEVSKWQTGLQAAQDKAVTQATNASVASGNALDATAIQGIKDRATQDYIANVGAQPTYDKTYTDYVKSTWNMNPGQFQGALRTLIKNLGEPDTAGDGSNGGGTKPPTTPVERVTEITNRIVAHPTADYVGKLLELANAGQITRLEIHAIYLRLKGKGLDEGLIKPLDDFYNAKAK
jgi:hypothetical protein